MRLIILLMFKYSNESKLYKIILCKLLDNNFYKM